VTRRSANTEGALQRAFQLHDLGGAIGAPTTALFRRRGCVSPSRHARSLVSMVAALVSRAWPHGPRHLTAPHLSLWGTTAAHKEGPVGWVVEGASKSSIPQCGYPIVALKRRLLFQNSDQCVR
jgi:hypothetical protein